MSSTMRPSIQVSVVMERIAVTGANVRWQTHQWRLADVIPWELQHGCAGEARLLRAADGTQRWLFADFLVELFKDDAAGYDLNLQAPQPGYFVLWRMEEELSVSTEYLARPETVTLSYHDAGRWLDAQESIEQVPAPADVLAWLRAFTDEHLVPEERKRKRPESFKRLEDRFGNPVSISTEKNRGGGPRA